jgi:hypothetical protein
MVEIHEEPQFYVGDRVNIINFPQGELEYEIVNMEFDTLYPGSVGTQLRCVSDPAIICNYSISSSFLIPILV